MFQGFLCGNTFPRIHPKNALQQFPKLILGLVALWDNILWAVSEGKNVTNMTATVLTFKSIAVKRLRKSKGYLDSL